MQDLNILSCFLTENERTKMFTEHTFSDINLMEIAKKIQHAASYYECPRVFHNIHELILKLENKRRTAAFCGHFSAGKSTLINQIIGENLLPSHPIPTSANIVHFQSGSPAAFSYLDSKTGETHRLTDNQWNEEWFTKSDKITEVYLTLPVPHFPTNLEILDTPGIDSTVKSHKSLAEARLVEADTVYYTVDYQKVESEENFTFLKQLNQSYITPVLLINQIDKHEKEEMAFSVFQQKIQASLLKKNIHVQNIYFISAADPSVNKKDWNAFLNELFINNESTVDQVIQTCALGIYRELEHLAAFVKEHIQPSEKTVQHMRAYISLPAVERALNEKKETLKTVPEWERLIDKDIFRECEAIFKNAKITPYHTRNLVRDYLESRQSSFRLKGIFSKNKTSLEKEKRKQKLIDSLNENVKNYIDVHLRNGIQRILSNYSIHSRSFSNELLSIHYHIDSTLLKRAERFGAQFSQDYVLTYSRIVLDEIRKRYKEILIDLLPSIKKAVREQQRIQTRQLSEEVSKLQDITEEWAQWEKDHHSLTKWINEVITQLKNAREPISFPSGSFGHTQTLYKWNNLNIKGTEVDIGSFYGNAKQQHRETFFESKEKAAQKLETAVTSLNKKGLSEIEQSLKEKASRLHQKTHRITLFGAFSAGKSSIANALLGEHFLPVSANPTTASVHYIQAPDHNHSHRSVDIFYKSEQEIMDDMNDILRPANLTLASVEDWYDVYAKNKEKLADSRDESDKEENQKPDPMELLKEEEITLAQQYYQSFHTFKDAIGEIKNADYEIYKQAAANEEHALLINNVNIYYDCSFTRNGYLLVDTPGIGSIYRRHSQIAFEEMKKSDAVLFVSYYNHAFSKADREFLLQLGRTKNYFSYDKFFFLVNAADLAQSKKELNTVLDYVKDQLIRLHITKPHVLPISGKNALKSYSNRPNEYWHTSGAAGFLDHFQQFAKSTLENTIMKEGIAEIRQAITILQQQKKSFSEEEQIRIAKKQFWQKELESFVEWLQTTNPGTEWKWIEQELEELLFYVKQRVFYRYYDEYKVLFNAARFENNESFSSQLHRYTNELIQFIFHEIVQEIRATIIRIEHFIQKQWGELQDSIHEKLIPEIRGFFVRKHINNFPATKIKEHVPVNSSTFSFISNYTSYHHFFVEQKNKVMKEQLEETLRPYGDQLIERYHHQLKQEYKSFFYKQWEGFLKDFSQAAETLITDWKEENQTEDTTELDQIINHLKSLI
ncbi:dynamin family protein [Alteribacillus sp. YIM 98480]|uniref:dynamin family protein n=1 Tax=Alteribacillus sp. YIM 98480 TaxID=2606599 RepID=UPI00131E67A5|nr:dynamin family protein [Alteribacillus sp. YIM 98480]